MTEHETNTDRDHDTETDGEANSDTTTTATRRQALAALLLGAGVGGTGAAAVAQSGSAASGGLGESGNPLEGAFVEQLDGPILDEGTPITQLVNIRVEETGTTLNADPGTLIIRYNP
jgi:hypothetical protein